MVEENARKAVESLYADKVKKGDYSFKGINLDEDSSKSIAEKLGIGGQTLLVVSGNKKIDITDKGFMNAHDLEKMKDEIKKAVELALKG
jgi:predicted transcriptional regulator